MIIFLQNDGKYLILIQLQLISHLSKILVEELHMGEVGKGEDWTKGCFGKPVKFEINLFFFV